MRIDRGGSNGASDFLIEPRRDLLQTPLDRRQRFRRRGAFDLPPRFGQKSGISADSKWGAGLAPSCFDAVGEFADLPLHPLERRGAQSGGSEEVAHFLRLPPDALERLGFDRRRGEAVDLAADGADLAFEPGGDRLRVVRLQRRAQFGRHRLERSQQRFAVAVLTHHLDPPHEVADRALERDHRIARRKVGEALAHGRDLGPHGAQDRQREPLGSLCSRRRSSSLSARARMSSRNDSSGGDAAAGPAGRNSSAARRDFRPGRRRPVRAQSDGGRPRRASSSWRRMAICDTAALRSSGGFGAGRSLGLRRAGPAGVDRFEPPDRIDQRLPIAVLRRIRTLEDLGDRFERPRGPRFGA